MALTVANPQGMQVVWFKRDLRVHDHAALTAAAQAGKVLCIYVCEPQLWQQPDASGRQWHFLLESLSDLQRSLARRGSRLHVLVGDMTEVLEKLHQQLPIAALYAHEETGNDYTYRRDIAVGQWCRQHRVAWQEFRQFGVVRRLRHRDDWKDHWESHNAAATKPVPAANWAQLGCLPREVALKDLPQVMQRLLPGLLDDNPVARQRGGRQSGIAILEDFLHRRSRQYRGGISSPLSATSACSRLSAHLAYGCLSLREIVQATQRHLASATDLNAHHQRGLRAFISRLYWHCHFIQKLESQPDIEWRNLHRGYDGLREADWNDAHFVALIHARTGWPLVDACVTMLRETGWLNFRMRAMLVSVASYALWLHWRPVGEWLARQFVDYEPGIHWSQMQMQAGTTGINTTRVYNPIKQARDQDPEGRFVRHWLPYMRQVPDAWLFEPWRMPDDLQRQHGLVPGRDLPLPLVDFENATRLAKARVHTLRRQPDVREAKAAIVDKHGSRQRTSQQRRARTRQAPETRLQLDLAL